MTRAGFLGLCYSDIFAYPLTKEELEKWQISLSVIARSPERSRGRTWQSQNNKKITTLSNNYYCLLGREKIIQLRQKRTKISEKKIILAEKTAHLLSKIPFVKMIAITGALAMKNSDEKDDIDFLIITQKNRVWLTRFLAVTILEVLGKRRRPNDEVFSNKICLNMFLDEENLKVRPKEQNLYSAHEVCQMKPIYNKEETYEKFLKQNSWVDKYLPRARSQRINELTNQGIKVPIKVYSNSLIPKFLNSFLDTLEVILYGSQYFYMKPKITREVIEKHRILFHPRDTAKMVLEEFEKRIIKQPK